MTARTRCRTCGHPGRHLRTVTTNKKPCTCACHTPPPPTFGRHRWPSWVDGDIEFEDAS